LIVPKALGALPAKGAQQSAQNLPLCHFDRRHEVPIEKSKGKEVRGKKRKEVQGKKYEGKKYEGKKYERGKEVQGKKYEGRAKFSSDNTSMSFRYEVRSTD
jgi:hypothetical protein